MIKTVYKNEESCLNEKRPYGVKLSQCDSKVSIPVLLQNLISLYIFQPFMKSKYRCSSS